MVILRYFSREILATTAAVSLVLLLVVLSGRFIQMLEKTANGELSVDLMLTMIIWRVPSSLELIVPLALTLSVLLAVGRMSQDSELTVLKAAGYSNRRLLATAGVPVFAVALLVGWLSLAVSPNVARELDRQVDARERLTVFDTVVPGRFQTGRTGRLIYAEGVTDNRESLTQVVIIEKNSAGADVYLTGARARQEFNDGEKYLVLFDGAKHVGRPGRLDWEVSAFERYVVRLQPEVAERPASLDTWSTGALIAEGGPAHWAIASFRGSLPLMCLVMWPFAFVLGQGGPRQSRLVWVIPVIVLQFGYVTALSFAEQAVTRGTLPPWPGLFWVHASFIGLAALLLGLVPLWRRRGWV